ncbi:MAG: hypothetical protein H8D23_31285 [Candidatus Brocadiales bacterium]|nr:hypothetical protein [Candidatus Brocadiales bacterium]
MICSDFLSADIIREQGCFARQKNSPLPGQKASRTRRREERKGRTKYIGHRYTLICAEVKSKEKKKRLRWKIEEKRQRRELHGLAHKLKSKSKNYD